MFCSSSRQTYGQAASPIPVKVLLKIPKFYAVTAKPSHSPCFDLLLFSDYPSTTLNPTFFTCLHTSLFPFLPASSRFFRLFPGVLPFQHPSPRDGGKKEVRS